MLLVPVQSTDIAAMGYDPVSAELQVQFRNGRIYSYQNISPDLYAGLVNASSKGSFLAQFVRKFPTLYPYTRIDGGINQSTLAQVGQNPTIASAAPSILEQIESFEGLL